MKNLKKTLYDINRKEYWHTLTNLNIRVIMRINNKTRIEINMMSITDTVRDAIDSIRR